MRGSTSRSVIASPARRTRACSSSNAPEADMSILYQDALDERANNLGALNGLKLVLVSLEPGPPPVAKLELEFYNTNVLAGVLTDINVNGVPPGAIFKVHGGRRVPAGDAVGQVRVIGVVAGGAADTLMLTVEPIGDYSTYTLEMLHPDIDPLLSQIPFKFRPGCFTNDCAPEWTPTRPPGPGPTIEDVAIASAVESPAPLQLERRGARAGRRRHAGGSAARHRRSNRSRNRARSDSRRHHHPPARPGMEEPGHRSRSRTKSTETPVAPTAERQRGRDRAARSAHQHLVRARVLARGGRPQIRLLLHQLLPGRRCGRHLAVPWQFRARSSRGTGR